MSLWKVFSRGIIEENPYFVLALSLCPGLAVTTSVVNGLTMGLIVWFVITSNNAVVFIIRKTINKKVRVPVYITCIATIVTCVQLFLQAFAPGLPVPGSSAYTSTWSSYLLSSWYAPTDC